ncbi:epimerase [Streptomyces sp. NRRL F-5123]|uniref:epimerase n=1 Tax=Streptomyces sp. NRRL F-5123 TaxID=1463856 RepID=UPI0004E1FB44|nr:epimerase [Streptomyces sp. NRRL F-5123]
MKVVVFGASGMIGHGALRAALLDGGVTEVVAVGRAPLGVDHPKLREVAHADFTDLSPVAAELAGADACFYCLGVSTSGHSAEVYRRVSYDFPLAAARLLSAGNPELAFTYVSGAGTDSTEQGRVAWARVKGRTENALLALDMRAYMFRPGWIRPVDGAVSRTPLYRTVYRLTSWLYPLAHRLAPDRVTTTALLGRSMLAAVRLEGAGPHILSTRDINRLGA